jgi:uncharacterized protein involved in type VI secretion and phage assembly
MFSLHLAGGTYTDLFPYELVLEEGISTLYKGILTVLTAEKHTHENLMEIVDKIVSLAITQKLSDGKNTRTRYLHGIVTGITSNGVFGAGDKLKCYRHILTIEPELARLRLNRATSPFYRKTPDDIIKEILAKHKLTAQIPSQYLNHSKFSTHLMFEQSGASDLDFLQSILSLYGLSFCYRHPAFQGLGSAELFFTEGSYFPDAVLEYSDKRKIPDVIEFDFTGSMEDKNIWKMDKWHISESIGVDGVELTAPYPNANYGSDKWRQGSTAPGDRFINFNHIFHGYERETPFAEIDNDIALILSAHYRSLQLAKSTLTGEASNIALQCGRVIHLAHFYGMDDKSIISALLTDTRLHCRTAWPQHLSVQPEGAGDETMAVALTCMNYGLNDKRYCARTRQQN